MRQRIDSSQSTDSRPGQGMRLLALAVLAAVAALFPGGPAFAQDMDLGVEATYIPNASYWIPGKREQAEYLFAGVDGRLSLLRKLDLFGIGVNRGFYLNGSYMVNEYIRQSTDGDFDNAEESVTTYGGGFMGNLPIKTPWRAIHFTVSIGLEQAVIEQTGQDARRQVYKIGGAGRVGLGYGPAIGDSGMVIRADLDVKYLALGQDETEPDNAVRNAQYQSWGLTLGYLWSP